MEFELTSELINEIVFSMEDQNEFYLLDSCGPVLLKKKEVPDPVSDRYYSLPVWDSISGFKLMEQFVTVLKNELVADKLRNILSAGKGVFRNFKNVLKEYPEIEKQWFSFKEQKMKQIILSWYNDPSITCTVIDEHNVIYNGEQTTLSRIATNKNGSNSNGALYFVYEGKTISQIRDEKEKASEAGKKENLC